MSNIPRNVVIIETDQQRADTIAALGADHMITPNLDRLVRDGVSFTNAFCCAATCVASRAALYTGQYAHNTGCYSFDTWGHQRTWVHHLQEAGYRTVALGKVHHMPRDAMMGFDDRLYVENFPEMQGHHDDYANYLKANGLESGCKLLTEDGRWLEKCASDVFPMDERHHVDQFVGRMAVRWIRDADAQVPFFLHIGFQGPHDPFDPPQRFLDMYADRPVPEPHRDDDGLAGRPPQYARHIAAVRNNREWDQGPHHATWAADLENSSPEDLRRMRRHYYAEITQIDEQVGHILGALEAKNLLDDTLVLFTSDHGDNLGDHGLMYKWLMTEQAVRVPMIVRLPGASRGGICDEGLFSQIDIGPTILEALGLPVPQRLDGTSNWQRLTTGAADAVPEYVWCEDNYLTMIRSRDRKLILYAGQEEEEYFDLDADPWEECNLVEDPARRAEINELKAEILDRLLVSRYLGSLPQIGDPDGRRAIWPANHPHDPHVLHRGCIGKGPYP